MKGQEVDWTLWRHLVQCPPVVSQHCVGLGGSYKRVLVNGSSL